MFTISARRLVVNTEADSLLVFPCFGFVAFLTLTNDRISLGLKKSIYNNEINNEYNEYIVYNKKVQSQQRVSKGSIIRKYRS